MKMFLYAVLAVTFAWTIWPSVAQAQGKDWESIGLGARQHVQHSTFTELPFGKNDISYNIRYQSQNPDTAWSLVLGYAPKLDGNTNVNYCLTPELNLYFKDDLKTKTLLPGFWRVGAGVLKTYQTKDSGDNEWTSTYFQAILGVNIPVGKFDLDIQGYYSFEDWDQLKDFDSENLEYGFSLNYKL